MDETWWVSEDQLIEEQLDVIGLPIDGSFLVVGPPGSGKTNLLLLRANYLHLSGHPKLVLIVFTRTLQEFLVAGASQYDFPASKIMTSVRWMSELLRSYGRAVPKSGNFIELRTELLARTTALVKDKKLTKLYDAILFDEAQDYWPEEITLMHRLATRVFIVADSRQKIYDGADSIAVAASLVDKKLTLEHHFRNGLKICRLADEIGNDSEDYDPMEPTSNYDETKQPSSVEPHAGLSLPNQISTVLGKLDLQRQTYPDEMIGICCPRNEEVDAVWSAIQASPFAGVSILQKADDHAHFGATSRICVSTIHAAKGLEFRALHLVGLEQLGKFSHTRNMAFTAVTRAKTSLSLYYSDKVPQFLESGIAKLEPLPDLPKVSALFGKPKGK